MKKFRNVTTAVKVKDFNKLAIHSESGKRKGCGMYCNKDEEYMVCPSCKTFAWHKSCLIPLYVQFGLKFPNIESFKDADDFTTAATEAVARRKKKLG